MECFGAFEHRRGLTLAAIDGEVRYGRTLLEAHPVEFIHDVRALEVDRYDVVISDFEPVTAWAARLAGKTSIGIAHQHAFRHPIPGRHGNLASRAVMRWFAPVDIPIGLHWHHFDSPILPPIIDTRLSRTHGDADFILVYLPFEQQSAVTALLQRFDDHRFVQYSPDLSDAEAGNVSLRRTCLNGFRADLCAAGAVICNAGFELVSECLHLGIPALVKPVAGQMEQHSNALALRQLGWGATTERLDHGELLRWLAGERPHTTVHYPDVAAALADWVLAGEWQDSAGLWEMLWSCTRHERNTVYTTP
jgi:uncharacterized protein (TIGR00661 family)